MAKDNGKTNFDQWFHDLSFKSSILVSIFTFGLFFSILYPQIPIVMMAIFVMQLYMDKYNLMYIYPLDFES